MNALSLQLQTHRLQSQLTQRELSAAAQVAYSTLRKIEGSGLGSISDLIKIFKALGMHAQLAALGFGDETNAPSANLPHRRRVRKSSIHVQPLPLPTLAQSPAPALLKSEHLGLSFPYDWSNPQIDDNVLIAKVLDKGRFADVSRIAAYFGMARIEQVAQSFAIALDRGPLGGILPALRQAQMDQQIQPSPAHL